MRNVAHAEDAPTSAAGCPEVLDQDMTARDICDTLKRLRFRNGPQVIALGDKEASISPSRDPSGAITVGASRCRSPSWLSGVTLVTGPVQITRYLGGERTGNVFPGLTFRKIHRVESAALFSLTLIRKPLLHLRRVFKFVGAVP